MTNLDFSALLAAVAVSFGENDLGPILAKGLDGEQDLLSVTGDVGLLLELVNGIKVGDSGLFCLGRSCCCCCGGKVMLDILSSSISQRFVVDAGGGPKGPKNVEN